MPKILLGIICGSVFGIVAVAMMIPLKFEDKRAAMSGRSSIALRSAL